LLNEIILRENATGSVPAPLESDSNTPFSAFREVTQKDKTPARIGQALGFVAFGLWSS
jgi:hypothetical protein